MTSGDITEMIAYSHLEPWGPMQEELRAAQICATVANVNRDTKRRPDPFTPADFSAPIARMEALARDQAASDRKEDAKQRSSAIRQALFGRWARG